MFLYVIKMDLARFIVDAADEKFKSDIINVEINMHCKYKYDLQITSNSEHVFVEYNTMKYKILKTHHSTYEEIIKFLIDEIENINSQIVNLDAEYGYYEPYNDENYNINYVIIKKKDKKIYCKKFEEKDITQTVWNYVKHLPWTI